MINLNKFINKIIYIRFPLLMVSLYILKNTLLTISLYDNVFVIKYFILWFTTILILRIDAQLNFIIAFIFFLLTVCNRIPSLKYTIDAENYAGWMFFFLTAGTIHLFLIEKLKLKSYPLKKIITFFKEDFHLLITIIIKSKNSLNLYQDKIKVSFNQYVNGIKNKYIHLFFSILRVVITVVYIVLTKVLKIMKIFILRTYSAYKKADYITILRNITILIVTLAVLYGINHQINRFINWSVIQPKIIKIEPKTVYRSTKIIIWGRSFGADPDGSIVKIMTNLGPVHKDFWTDTKIYITVPLSWKDGPMKLWVEKPVLWDGHWTLRKSNIVTINLLPVTGEFTPADDTYFNQLKYLDKETLKLNGYE